jgi:glutamate transport system ATP-binding protein
MTSNGHLIEIEHVRKSFGSHLVLDGIDLAISTGEAVVIAGPSGSGKSTLLRCINGLETIDEGDIRFDGRSVPAAGKDLFRLRAEIGMVFQSFNLFAHKSVLDNITLGPIKVKDMSEQDATRLARGLLERVGIPEKADDFPADLSGGQQQRVAIARSLVTQPTVLFADEPTGNLDSSTGAEILKLLRASVEERGQTIVMVTHDPRAGAVADRVLHLEDGRIVNDENVR